MIGHLTLLLLALVRSEDETCLLHLKSERNRVEGAAKPETAHLMLTATGAATSITIQAAQEQQRAWQTAHAALKQRYKRYLEAGMNRQPEGPGVVASSTLKADSTGVQDFIKRSKESEQSCFAKLPEVRRSLDGVMAKVNALSDIVEGHEAIIEGNTDMIRAQKDGQKEQIEKYKQAKEECDKQYNEAMLGLQQHRLDQIEMEHIANPEVRSKIGYHTNFTEEVQAHNDLVAAKAARWAKMEETAKLARKAKAEQEAEDAAKAKMASNLDAADTAAAAVAANNAAAAAPAPAPAATPAAAGTVSLVLPNAQAAAVPAAPAAVPATPVAPAAPAAPAPNAAVDTLKAELAKLTEQKAEAIAKEDFAAAASVKGKMVETTAALAKLGVVALAEAATSVTLANSSIVLHSEPLALVELGASGTASLGAQISHRLGQLSTEACAQMVHQLALVETRQDPAPVAAAPAPTANFTRYADDAATLEKCSGAREELQRTFNDTWNKLSKLIKDGEELGEKELKTCRLEAETQHEEAMDAFEDRVQEATTNMNGAMAALKQLNGLLENAKEEARLLEEYIQTLSKDCEIQSDVSEHIKGILELIKSLEACPGRNDFRLVIPGSTTDRIGIGTGKFNADGTPVNATEA